MIEHPGTSTRAHCKSAPTTPPSASSRLTLWAKACVLLIALIVTLGCADRALAASADEVHVSYQWYGSDPQVTEDYETFDVTASIGSRFLYAAVMPDSPALGHGASWRVMKNFAGGILAGEEDITDEASYDEDTGVLSLPASRAGEDVTVVFTMPWDHASHAGHGHFRGSARQAGANSFLHVQDSGSPTTQGAGGFEAGAVYPLSITSGANGLESNPAIYGSDTNVRSAGTVMGYPEFDGRYKFYVVFTKENCELFRLVDETPGRQGNGGIIYGGTGTPYDFTWARDYKWCSADCVENVYNGAGMPVPINGSGSWVRIDSITETELNCTFRIECNNPNGTNAQDIMGTFSLRLPKGAIALQKESADSSITDGNACYSLAGAVYGVFESQEAAQTRDASQARATYVTDENGAWETENDYFAGTYYIAELEPPLGYELNEEILSVTVDAGETALVHASDRPLMGPASSRVQKKDAATGTSMPQGDASLEGAEITFCYYDGYYAADGLPDAPTRTWVMRTGADGVACPSYGESAKVAGDDFYRFGDEIAFPLGTVTATETKAPEGYLLGNPETLVMHIASDETSRSVSVTTVSPTKAGTSDDGAACITDYVERGRLVVGKTSRENGGYFEQGAASLEGWAFEIVNASAGTVIVDGSAHGPGDVVKTIETHFEDGLYVADTGEGCLPYGTYEVHEVQTSRPQDVGYLFDGASEGWSRTVTIRDEGQAVYLTGADDACQNQVVRGDLEFSKAKSPGMERLAGIPFKVTSATTGEWHIIVTDRNGYASTASSANAHGSRTNENDKALGADGVVDASLLDDEAGVWFDGGNGAPTTPNEGKGALPFDTYILEELRVPANEGLDLVTVEATVYRDGAVVDLGTLEDTAGEAPRIGTTLADANGNKVLAARADALLVDTVSFNNLDTSQTYTLAGELYSVEGGQATELVATSVADFKPNLSHGSAQVAFEFDATGLEGKTLVCFERLLDAGGNEIARHEDASDEGQTVSVPAIGTTLSDSATGKHIASLADMNALELTDTVSYVGLSPNATYTLTGTLHDGITGDVLIDANGAPVTASRSFTPRQSDGSIDIDFAFNLENASGMRIVAFESLTCHGVEYASHADLADEGQTVTVPSIGTELTNDANQTHAAMANGSFTLTDSVAYQGLEPNARYTLTGTLHDKATGEPVLSEAGVPVTASSEFVPEEPSGTAEVSFEFSADLAGRSVVAFETLRSEDRIYAVHADIENQSQTVSVPRIGTTLLDRQSESHTAGQEGPYTLVDTVTYEGLAPGEEYTVSGSLHDKETGDVVLSQPQEGRDGTEEARASLSFVPSEPNGTLEVVFELDADLAGRTVVAFEELRDSGGNVIAEHADIDDVDQSVRFPIPPALDPEPESSRPSSRSGSSGLAKTGDVLANMLIVLVPAGALGLVLASLSVRRMQREREIVIERGKSRVEHDGSMGPLP